VGGVDDPRASHGREERLREDTGEVRAKAMKARVERGWKRPRRYM